MECSADDCKIPAIAKGLCNKHYRRMKKGKDINEKSFRENTDEENFLKKVNKNNSSGCWIWTGSTRGPKRCEYGGFGFRGKIWRTNRVAWVLWKGEIPENLCVCHTCDNPLCVNPDHLFLGTNTDNMRDKLSKNRDANKNKTHCPRGHEYNIKNTYTCKKGLRHCRECHRIRERARILKIKSNESKKEGGDLF